MNRRLFVLLITAAVFAGTLLLWISTAGMRSAPPWGQRRGLLDGAGGSAEQADAPGAASEPSPKAVVEESLHDFGILDPAERCEHTFAVRNEGDAPLALSRGPTSCKCTMSDLPPRPIPPGTTAPVRIASKIAQKSGQFSHSATIFTNDPANPRITLRIQGTLRHYVAADPPRIVLSGVRREESKSVDVTIYSQVWDAFRIEEITSTLDGMSWEPAAADAQTLAKLDARSGHRLRVTLPANLASGEFWHELRMSVVPEDEGAAPRSFELDIAGTVLSRISIFGAKIDAQRTVRLGVVRQGEGVHERLTMKVRDNHRRLRIERVETEPDLLRVSVSPYESEREDLGLYRIDLEVPPDAPMGDHLSQPGKIRIITDHPRLPVLSLDVAFAVVSR